MGLFKNLFQESVKQLYIEYDPATMVYRPGDIVKGNVIMEIDQPINARRVMIYFIGKARTYWTETRTDSYGCYDPCYGGYGTTYHTYTVTFSAEEYYVNMESLVWGNGHESSLSAGSYRYPFTFRLPTTLPPSFEGEYGGIRYYVKAKIDRPWKIDDEVCSVISIMPQLDLNSISNAGIAIAMDAEQELGCCCCKNGFVYAKITVSQYGYVPGQTIMINIAIRNDSSKEVTKIQTRLMEYSNYYASEYVGSMEVRTCSQSVFNYVEEFKVPAKTTKTYVRKYRIPAICPTFNNSNIIQAKYALKVDISTSSFWDSPIQQETPILIGTVPLNLKAASTSVDVNNFKGTLVFAPSVFGPGITHGGDSQSSGFTPKCIYYKDAE